MAGIRALRKIQLGAETTAGTIRVATTLWRGVGTIEDQREIVFPDEDVGYISGVDRSYSPKTLAALAMEDTPATFEQLPYVLAAGVKSVITGVADGSGSGKIYTYTFHTTTPNTLKTYTLEGGDNQQAEVVEYGFVEGFKLSGKGGAALTMSADWKGRQVAPQAFTGSVALPTVEEILFGKGLLFIDTAGGTIGTTTKSNTLLGADLDVKTGVVPVFAANGNLYFSFTKAVAPEVSLKITFEHEATAVAEIAVWRAQTPRLIRLKWTGSTLGTAGTTYTFKTLIVDLAGRWEKFDKIAEQDGNDIVTGTFRARYNATAAKFAEIVVVNDLASLP